MAVEHIMRLGGWESPDMVQRYTGAVTFSVSLKFYKAPLSEYSSTEKQREYLE
jgi:hypothetical protein